MKKKVVAIFGYNNTRIYDVEKIAEKAAHLFSAGVLLVKEGVVDADRAITPYCFDHAPDDPEISESLRKYVDERGLELIACLPFSDKGVIGAANAAREFGLFGDDPITAPAMLNKYAFREIEASVNVDPSRYLKPKFERTKSEDRLRDRLAEDGPYFLKPTSEGNSRGCMKITSMEDLDRWLVENPGSAAKGVICEDILALSDEYSFDGVGGNYWITKKFTTTGAYRAEYQHVVPAPLSPAERDRVHSVLEPLLDRLGTRGGAFHHEFFLLGDGRIASVEPNRRPAGMWIWDLAASTFANFDPWARWLEKCGGVKSTKEALHAERYSGVRGIIAKKSGEIGSFRRELIVEKLRARFGECVKVSFFKREGDFVRSEPRDNSDFLAFVSVSDPDYASLLRSLDEAEHIFLSDVEVNPCA